LAILFAVNSEHIACLHQQNKSGFFGGQASFQPIGAFSKPFRLF